MGIPSTIVNWITDGYLEIDPVTRQISLMKNNGTTYVPSNDDFYLGAEQDTKIQHVVFKLPKTVEGVDLSQCSVKRVWLGEVGSKISKSQTNISSYVDENDLWIVWEVTHSITTVLTGWVALSLCLQNTSSNNNLTTIHWEFNSQPYNALIVETLHGTEEYPEVIVDAYDNVDSWEKSPYYFENQLNANSFNGIEINDATNLFTIGSENRTISVPTQGFDFGLKTDHHIKSFFVQFPDSFNGTSLTTEDWNGYIEYTNAKGQTDHTPLVRITRTTGSGATAISNTYYAFKPNIGMTCEAGLVRFSFSLVKTENSKIIQAFNSQPEYADVLDTVEGGETLQISSPSEFARTLERYLPLILPDTINAMLSINDLIFNGDVWSS